MFLVALDCLSHAVDCYQNAVVVNANFPKLKLRGPKSLLPQLREFAVANCCSWMALRARTKNSEHRIKLSLHVGDVDSREAARSEIFASISAFGLSLIHI